MKGVIYENRAAAAADTAKVLYPRLGDAVEAIEWAVVRDPTMGWSLLEGSRLRLVIFEGAKSVGMPTIEVIFEETPTAVVIHDMVFS